jgi:protein SCO1
MSAWRAATCAALAAALLGAGSAWADRDERPPGGVLPEMDYAPPPAGSYALNVIQPAPDGAVIDERGRPRRLAEYTRGRVTLLSLIYTYCTERTGCVLAYETSMELKKLVLADPKLRGRVQFVSLSFDPINDSPETMRLYGGEYARAGGPLPWHFLTTASVKALKPILDGFDQEIEVELDEQGRPTRTISHILKLFLIDREGRVREIYSTAFLQPEAMLNDIRTLVMEEDAARH